MTAASSAPTRSSTTTPEAPESSHPTIEAIFEYRDELLSETQAEAVQEHLVTCRQCADLLLEAQAFDRPAAAESEKYRREAQLVAREVLRQAAARPAQLKWPIAAALVLVVGVAGFVGHSLGRNEANRPPGTPPITNLNIVEIISQTNRSTSSEVQTIEVDATKPLTAVIIAPSRLASHPDYELRLLEVEDGLLWSRAGLTADEFGSFKLALATEQLSPGAYRFELSGIEGSQRVPLESFNIRVREIDR